MDSQYGKESKQVFPEDRNMEFLKFNESHKVYIPTADNNGNTSWGELTAVTRHDPSETLYEFTTESGRKVIVADSESMLIWNDEKEIFEKKQSRDIKIGEYAPVIASLPAPPIINTSINQFKLNYENGVAIGLYLSGIKTEFDTFLDKVAGNGIPEFAYNAPKEFIIGLLEKLTPDAKIIEGVSMLYAQLDESESVKKDKIIKIQEISNHNEIKLYDVTVPSTLNFSIANGLNLRDTLILGFKSNRNVLIWDKNIIKPFNGPIIIHSC